MWEKRRIFPHSARTELRIQHRKGWDGAGGDLSLSLLSQPSSRAAWSHHHHHHHQRVTETPAKKPGIFMCHSVPHSSAWRVQRRRKREKVKKGISDPVHPGSKARKPPAIKAKKEREGFIQIFINSASRDHRRERRRGGGGKKADSTARALKLYKGNYRENIWFSRGTVSTGCVGERD